MSVIARIHGTLPGDQPPAGVVGPGVGEEDRPGEERGIVDVGAGDLAEQRVALQRGERAHVAGHVADRGDAAQQRPRSRRSVLDPGVFARGIGRDVDVGVDQARDQVSAGQIVDRGARRQRAGSRREDRGDALALNQHGLVRPDLLAGAVEQRDTNQHDSAGAVG